MTSAESRTSWFGRRGRTVAAWTLVIAMGVGTTASVLAVWVHRTVLDTGAFMETVAPVVESDAVQQAVSTKIADELTAALDIEGRIQRTVFEARDRAIEELGASLDLPPLAVGALKRADLGHDLAPVLADGIETRIRSGVEAVLTSEQGRELLLDVIRVAHERTVLLLRDELDALPNVVVAEGEVRLDLVPLIGQTVRTVVAGGVDMLGIEPRVPVSGAADDPGQSVVKLASALGQDLSPEFGQVAVMSDARLRSLQGLLMMFDRAVWLLLIASVLLAGLAVALAETPATGLIRVGAACLVASLVGWAIVRVVTTAIFGGGGSGAGVAVGDVANAVVNGLLGLVALLALVGVVVGMAGIAARRSTASASM